MSKPLPVKYMKILRHVTGYWGAYPLAQSLAPGMVGRRVEGRFVQENVLWSNEDYPGWDAERFSASKAESRQPAEAWVDQNARIARVEVGAGGGALGAEARFRLEFSGEDQGAFVCQGARSWKFDHLRWVKEHIVNLWRQGLWTRKDILITEVLMTDSSYASFSTSRGHSIDFTVAASPPEPTVRELLKLAVGEGRLDMGGTWISTSGYTTSLESAGTPLFQAIRIKRFPTTHAEFVVKGPGDFEEATFGEASGDSDDED